MQEVSISYTDILLYFLLAALASCLLTGNKLMAQHIKPEPVFLVTFQSNYTLYIFTQLSVSAGQNLAAVTEMT